MTITQILNKFVPYENCNGCWKQRRIAKKRQELLYEIVRLQSSGLSNEEILKTLELGVATGNPT